MIRPSTRPRLRATAVVIAVAMAALALTATTPAATAVAAPEPGASTPVPVGGGSYAAAPPASLDRPGRDVTGVVNKKLYIDSSLSGEPVPTNKWWSDLIVSKFSGNLWADPFVVSNNEIGRAHV